SVLLQKRGPFRPTKMRHWMPGARERGFQNASLSRYLIGHGGATSIANNKSWQCNRGK
ncbi:hypothetical protein MCOR15_010450, partial [Pyricularia oryzae]